MTIKFWLEKNYKWLWIIVFAIIIWIAGHGIIDNIEYHIDKAKSKAEVKLSESRIRLSEKRAERALMDAERWENAANIKDGQISAIKVDIEREKARRKEAEVKIATMMASEIVVKARAILETDEIQEQTQGIVFTLVAARKNLTVLESSFSLAEENKKLIEAFNLSERKSLDLEKSIIKYKEVIIEKDFIIGGKDVIIQNWKENFNLSEIRNKKKWRQGFKWGAITTGGIIFIIKIFIGK